MSARTTADHRRYHIYTALEQAYCGQAARSSTAEYGDRGGHIDARLPPRCRTSGNSPSSGRHQGDCADSVLAGSEDDGGTGEAGGILFATSSRPAAGGSFSALWPLDEVKEEEGKRRFSPSASAGTAGSGDRESGSAEGGAGRLEHATPADAEIGESEAGSAAQRVEGEPQSATNSGMRDSVATEPDQERREAPGGALREPLVMADGTRALGVVGADAQARQQQRQAVESATSSAGGGGQGRRRGGSGIEKARNKRGEELGGPKQGGEDHDNPDRKSVV